jgi:hypothetical protein
MGYSKRKRDDDYEGWAQNYMSTPVATGSSSIFPIVLDSPEKPAKKPRKAKAKDPDAPQPEKRGASK